MENHLIIGLGGTGGRIIRSIRTTILQNHGNNVPEDINIDYLYLDTSNDDTDSALKWKEQTSSIGLTPANIVKIDKTPLISYLNNIDAYHTIKPWIGTTAQWGDVVPAGEVAAGQKRRYGRFLLACEISEFIKSLNTQVQNLIAKTPDKIRNVTFHVCCGLAGGTGSGMVVDIISQIRKIYAFDDNNFFNAIYVYALLPELTPTTWDSGTYHANGYAALKELNELSFLKYSPYDLSDQSTRSLRLGGDPNIQAPHVLFNGCYIFTNENENDVQLNVTRDIPDLVGSYIYKKIFSVTNHSARQFINRVARCENGINEPEEDASQPGKPLRGRRFLTFGIKRIGIPEIEIKSFLSAQFARQAALQLLYNSWFETQGYTDEPRQKQFNQYVAASENLERWLLSDQHLTLSKLVLPSDIQRSTWTTFVSSWEKKKNEFNDIVTNDRIPKSNWILELKKKYDLFFTESFRGEGVARFFLLKEKDIKDTVRFIVDGIEKDLFGQWRNADFGLAEIGFLLNDLILLLENKKNVTVNEKATKLQSDEAEYKHAVEAEDLTWDKIGWLSDTFGEKKKSFVRQNQNLELLFRTRTQLRGWEYARKLLPEIITGLTELNKKIAGIQAYLNGLLGNYDKIILAKCQDTSPQISDHFVKFYDSKLVRNTARQLTLEKEIQTQQSAEFRTEMAKKLEGNANFTQFEKKLPENAFIELLETHAERTISVINQQMKDKIEGGKKIFDISITERLREQYQNDMDGLRAFIRNLVTQAAVFVKYNGIQENLDPNTLRQMEFIVIMPPDAKPEGNNPNTFNHMLKEAFKTSRSAGISDDNIIYTESKKTEITLLNIHNLFPLRF